jgi:alkaline phosphatase D
VPPEYQRRLLLTVEDWDGAPNERNALLTDIADVENVVVFTGDLHAIFAGTPYPDGNPDARVIEFVCGSVSSTTWLAGMQAILASDRTLPTGAALLAGLIDTLLQHPEAKPNPHMGWFDLQRNGYAVARAGADELSVEIFAVSDGFVSAPPAGVQGINLFTPVPFRVRTGTRDLEQWIQGEYRTWDRDTLSWV